MGSTVRAIDYRVNAAQRLAHLFEVTLTIPEPAATQQLSLPVWIPGSYLVREFAKHLQQLQAEQDGQTLAIEQRDKCNWLVTCSPDRPLPLRYQVYAIDNSVRTAWLDAQRGFFNGTSLCLRVHGQETAPHRLTLSPQGLPRDWQAATALTPIRASANGFGSYLAADYDELVDSPVMLGHFWSGSFVADGVPHRFVVDGATPAFDGERLLADTRRICETAIRFWHGKGKKQRAPQANYLFMLTAVDNGYGGLEHRNSTALICKRVDLPRHDQPVQLKAQDGYTTLLGLISHEYFHTWNVKRLRPVEFTRYDYGGENYTALLWFFEGFTSYYDDLLLRRAGLIDDATYLTLLAKTITQVLQTPGRRLQSVAKASWDAWIKYYRPDENTANATVSYYTKGALVALCLDLSLRQSGRASLDAVMRALWQRCQGGPMREDDLREVLQTLSGESFDQRLAEWVHGTAELPLEALLTQHGVRWQAAAASLTERLGLSMVDTNGVQLKSVWRESAAEQAGLAAGDEWLGIEVGQGKAAQAWRLNKLDELPLYLGTATQFKALVARDRRLLTLPLTLPSGQGGIELAVQDAARISSWLDESQPRIAK